MNGYRGRIAPTPTGYLHLGHARTFMIAQKRAEDNEGILVFRNEDLDRARCKKEFVDASIYDLKSCGLNWQEGPDKGGSHCPYNQSERLDWYLEVWKKLRDSGCIYPCEKSRKDVQNALQAPHNDGSETIFPLNLRPPSQEYSHLETPGKTNWRFRVPEHEKILFEDNNLGNQEFESLKDFGDFLIWRKDGFPSYELAVVVDDHEMGITEVVRGEDLLLSTARQILLYRSLDWKIPEFYHCRLVKDKNGQRLAKRDKALSLRSLIASGEWETVKNDLISSSFTTL